MGRNGRTPGLLLCLVAAGCNGTDGNYEASVIALQHDVRASFKVAADGDMELLLERWHGSEAFGWERCPVLHAEATVNGEPMQLVRAGGWVPPYGGETIFDGSGGYCEPMLYRLLDPPVELLQMEGVRVEVRDEGGVIAIEVPFIGMPELALAEPRVLLPGERADIAILPSAGVVDVAAGGVSYNGELAQKAPGNANVYFKVSDLEATAAGFAFTVPAMQLDSRGLLTLWPETPALRVTRCEGVGSCEASRTLPGPINLELSISATGDEVQPDPREDHAQWHSCWLSGEVTGGLEFAWTDAINCQWSVSDARVLQARFHEGPYDSFSLKVEDFVAEKGARMRAQVEVKQVGRSWLHTDCMVAIDRVWSEIPSKVSTVVEGTGECTGAAGASQASDGPVTIEPFAFRVPAEPLEL